MQSLRTIKMTTISFNTIVPSDFLTTLTSLIYLVLIPNISTTWNTTRRMHITNLHQVLPTSYNKVENIKTPYEQFIHVKHNHSHEYAITDTLTSRLRVLTHYWFSVSDRTPHWSFTKHQSPKELEEILDEVPNHEFDDQLLCFELTTSLNSNEDVVKVMGADIPLVVQAQAFPELTGLYKMVHKAQQDKKDWEEMLAMREMRLREWEIDRLRNNLIMLNRFYPVGGIVAAHPS